MSKSSSPYPLLAADRSGRGVVSQAGAAALAATADRTGLAGALSAALAPWRKPLASHDPGKIICDLAITLAIGGDCLADIGLLRAEPAVFGPVASDPTVALLISILAADAPAALSTIATARAAARGTAWTAAGDHAPDAGTGIDDPLVIDIDATLVGAHSDKEAAAPTYKRDYGCHPLCAFVDHGADDTGEPLTTVLRTGSAGSNTVDDHKQVLADALAQLPAQPGYRAGKKILVRTNAAGGTYDFLQYVTNRRLSYSIGFGLTGL